MSAESLAKRPTAAPPTQPASNAEKARALIAMLEPGQALPSDVPADRLRDWARDLIRTVEEGGATPPQPAAEPPRRRRLFAAAPPKLSDPAPDRPAAVAQPRPEDSSAAPIAHVAERPASRNRPAQTTILAALDVRKLVDATVDAVTLAREHPAIVAMTLLGKPTMEQANALRRLPGGQVRAVHRALRELEQRAQMA